MKKHIIVLPEDEQEKIKCILSKGSHCASIRKRAQALLLSHEGNFDDEISKNVLLTARSICNIRKKYCEEGFDSAVYGKKRSGRPVKFDKADEAELTAIACSSPPEGRARWTLELMKKKIKKPIGKSTISVLLKKTAVSLGDKKCGA